LELRNYASHDGQIEIDLIGEKKGEMYIFEIKWRNKSVNIKDIIDFVDKAEKSSFALKKKKFFVFYRTDSN